MSSYYNKLPMWAIYVKLQWHWVICSLSVCSEHYASLNWSEIAKMRRRLFSFVILSFLVVNGSAEYCKLDTKSCCCIADSGYGVDLHNLQGKPLQGVGDAGTQYLLSLCSDSLEPKEAVNGTNACQAGYSVSHWTRWHHHEPVFDLKLPFQICKLSTHIDPPKPNTTEPIILINSDVVLANQLWTAVNKADKESSVTFEYSGGSLRLVCIKDDQDHSLVANGTHLFLYSPNSCVTLLRPPPPAHEGLGTGAVISIIILVTLFSYCTLGVFYNHFMRGARGMELIPNLDFWRGLPGLVLVCFMRRRYENAF